MDVRGGDYRVNSAGVRSRWTSACWKSAVHGASGHLMRVVAAAETYACRQTVQMASAGVSARKSLFEAPRSSCWRICANESNGCAHRDVVWLANIARDLNSLQKWQIR